MRWLDRFLNKSFVTNFLSFAVLALAWFLPETLPGRRGLLMTGMFAFSGAITNWLAVYMLFERVPFLYGSGVIPLRFESFKGGIRRLIMNNFFTEDNFRRFMREGSNGGIAAQLEHIAQDLDYELLFDGFKSAVQNSKLGPMVMMFGGERGLDSLKDPFTAEARRRLTQMVGSPALQELLHSRINSYDALRAKVEFLVDQRLAELTPDMVKVIIQNMIQKHLGWLVVWGGVFGALLGLLGEIFKIV